jgi:7SK snRNA methylphosphate capping enzyme
LTPDGASIDTSVQSPTKKLKNANSSISPDKNVNGDDYIFSNISSDAGWQDKSFSLSRPQNNQNNRQKPSKKKKKINNGQKWFQYGNYPDYYDYRTKGLDPRIKALKKEWFENKKCLDIGCNSGKFTIDVAMYFRPKSILGIDIDAKLIEAAGKHLEERKEFDSAAQKKQDSSSHDKDVNNIEGGDGMPVEYNRREIVKFRQENCVENDVWDEKFEVIFCMSVVKWIHLNWGDDGVRRLFKKVHEHLEDGGLFVLEAQPWSSYKKKQRASEVTKQMYKTIRLYPEDFKGLLESMGFEFVEGVVPQEIKKGFGRAIDIYRKKATQPDAPQQQSNVQEENK